MRRSITSGLLAALAFVLAHAGASAATCTAEDFAAAVDKSGAQLRAFNAEALPKLQDKLKQLKDKKGWDEEKALDSVRDDRTTKLDAEAEDLIVKIDMLGRPPEKGTPDCSKLAELEAAGLELLAVMKAKSTYTLAKLETQIAGAGGKEVAAASKDPAPTAKEAKPAAARRCDAAQTGCQVDGAEVGDADEAAAGRRPARRGADARARSVRRHARAAGS